MSIDDLNVSSVDAENALLDVSPEIQDESQARDQAVAGVEVAQATNEAAPPKSDRLPAENAPVAELPKEVVPDQNNVAHLPANVSVDEIRVDGNNLILVQADGTEITIVNGALRIPTFLIDDVEVPQQVVLAVLEQDGIDVAAGPDGSYSVAGAGPGSSGAEFDDGLPAPDLGPGPLASLLGNTELEFGATSNIEESFDDTPVINGVTEILLAEDASFEGDFENQTVNGVFGFDGGNDDGVITSIAYVETLNRDEATGAGALTSLTHGGVPVVVTASADGLTLTGMAGEVVVFTLTVNDVVTGAFTFVQSASLDHPDLGETGVEDLLRLHFTFTVTDNDGDTAIGDAFVDIGDDAPVFGEAETGAVDEDYLGLVTGGEGEGDGEGGSEVALLVADEPKSGTTTGGSLNIDWGADNGNAVVNGGQTDVANDRSVVFTADTVAQLEAQGLTSDGVGLTYVLSDDGTTLYAYKDGEIKIPSDGGDGEFDGGALRALADSPAEGWIFKVTLSDTGNGSYEFELAGNLDHPDASSEDDLALEFKFTATDSDGDSGSSSFSINVNDDVPVEGEVALYNFSGTYSSGAVNLRIPAVDTAGSIESSIEVPTGGTIADINVSINLTHTYMSDLEIYLVAPDGTTIRLVANAGGSADPNGVITFDDEAAQSFGSASAPFTGTWRPDVDQLSLLDGKDMSGTWTLHINDDAGGDIGTLFNWSLQINSATAGPLVNAIVDESDLSAVGGDLATGNGNEGVGDDSTVTDGSLDTDGDATTVYGRLGISWGSDDSNTVVDGGISVGDGDRSVTFGATAVASLVALGLTSQGDAITYSLSENGAAITATAGERVVFTVSLSDQDSGSFRFDLNDVIDHPVGGGENNVILPFSYTATDSDGDSFTSSFSVGIDDDSPYVGESTRGTVEDEAVNGGNDEAADELSAVATGSLAIRWGADDANNGSGGLGDRSVAFTNATVTVAGAADDALSSLGRAVHTTILEDGTLVGYVGGTAPTVATGEGSANVVFYATLSDASNRGSYSFTLVQPLDHAAGSGENTLSLTLNYTATDSDGDTATGSFVVDVVDDIPAPGEAVSVTVDEDDINTLLSSGNHPNDGIADGSLTTWYGAATVSGSVASTVSFGSDDQAAGGGFSFTANAVATLNALNLTSKGGAIVFTIVGDAIVGYVNNAFGGYQPVLDRTVLSLTLNPETGEFTFNQYDQLDHVAGNGENTALKSGSGSIAGIDFGAVIDATDGDGDVLNLAGKLTVTIRDDMPETSITLDHTVTIDETIQRQNDDTTDNDVRRLFNNVSNKGSDGDLQGPIYASDDVIDTTVNGGADDNVTTSLTLRIDNAASGLFTTDGQPITLSLENGIVVGRIPSGVAAFAVTIEPNGQVSVAQYLSLKHGDTASNDEGIDLSGKISAVLTSTDYDGDTVVKSVSIGDRVVFEDDGPRFTGTTVSITSDEDDILNTLSVGNSPSDGSADGSLSQHSFVGEGLAATVSGSIASVVAFGADGAASGGGFSFAANTTTVLNGLGLTSQGGAVVFEIVNGAILGYVDLPGTGYRPVMSLTLNPQTGEYTFRQYDQVDHVSGNGENTALKTATGSIAGIDFGSVINATDGDGDTVNLAGKFTVTIRDDMPVTTISAVGSVTIDETAGIQNNDTTAPAVANLFTAVSSKGTDTDLSGPVYATRDVVDTTLSGGTDDSVTTSLALRIDNAASGLFTTDGQAITLTLENGIVVGRIPSGVAAFAIAIEPNGQVSIAQYLSLKQGNTGSTDEAINLANKISAVFTATDYDGDVVEKSVSIGDKVIFEDDGPSVSANTLVQLDEDVRFGGNAGGNGDDIDGAALTGTLAHNGGADGTSSVLWASNGLTLPSGFWYSVSADGKVMTITQLQGGSYVPVVTVTITNTATGAYSVSQVAPIDHPQGTIPGTEDNVQFTVSYLVKDGDNDVATGTLSINVDDDTPTVGANPVIQLDDDALLNGIAGGTGDDVESAVLSGTLSHSGGADGTASVFWAPNGLSLPSGFWFDLSADGKTMTITQLQGGSYVAVFKAVITDTATGAYELTQLAAVKHNTSGTEDNLEVSFQYRVTDGDNDVATGTLTVNMDDDTPVARAETAKVTEASPTVSNNLIFAFDVSGSMGDDANGSAPGNASRLAVAKQAAINLINASDAAQVLIVTFADNANTSVWMTKQQALDFINGGSFPGPNGGTEYGNPIGAIQAASNPPPAGTTSVYFFSDGDVSDSDDLTTAERQAWENFLDANHIKSYAVGVGTDVAVNDNDLKDVAHQTGDPIVITTGNNAALLATAATPPAATSASGNVLSNDGFGADGGHIASITVDGVTYAWDGAATITKSGAATGTLVGAALDLVTTLGGHLTFNFATGAWTYAAPADVTTNTTENFAYTLVDGDGDTAASSLQIAIDAVNDAPVNTVPTAQTVAEDQILTLNGLTVGDVDANGGNLTVTLEVDHGKLNLVTAAGLTVSGNGTDTITVTGTVAAINAAINGLKYQGLANFNGADQLKITTSDNGNTGLGGVKTDVDTVNITVSAVNDAPSLSPDTRSVTFTENGNEARLFSNVTITDPDNPTDFVGGSVSISLGATAVAGDQLVLDALGVQVSGSNVQVWNGFGWTTIGQVTSGAFGTSALVVTFNANATAARVETLLEAVAFKSTSEDPTAATRTATVVFNDGGNDGSGGALSDTSTITVNVIPVNDAPVFAGSDYRSFSVNENTTAVGSVSATDVDGGALTYSIVNTGGTDFNKFNIDPVTGALTFKAAPDYENPSDIGGSNGNNIYVIDVKVSDGKGGEDIQTIEVTVNNVNEAPVLTPVSASVSYTEQQASAVKLMSNAGVTDADNPSDFSGGSVSVSLGSTAVSGDSLVLVTDSGIRLDGNNVQIKTGPQSWAWTTIGQISGNGSGTITVSLNGNATSSRVETLLEAIAFNSTSDNPTNAARTATVVFNDGGNDGTGGALTDTSTITINVTPVNDAPTTNAVTASGAEDSLISVPLSGSDIDGTVTGFVVKTLPSNGILYSDAAGTQAIAQNATVSGTVYFKPSADYNGTVSFTYAAKDDGNLADTTPATATITVTPVNDAPTAVDDVLSPVAEDSGVRTISFASLLNGDGKGAYNETTQSLTITAISDVVGGTAVISGTNILFTPAANFSGTASFNYTVQDNGQTNGTNDFKTDVGSVSFPVTPVNDEPTTNPATGSGEEDSTIAVTLSGADIDGTVAGYVIKTLPVNGILYADQARTIPITLGQVINASTVYFRPTQNYSGDASFQYAAVDNGGAEDATPATASISITPVVDGFSFGVQHMNGDEDTSIALHIWGNLYDTDGSETLTFTISDIPVGAVLSDGTNSFTATAGNTSVNIAGWTLSALAITPPVNSDADFALRVTGTATETANGDSISGDLSLNVTVHGVADAPALTVTPASGDEDTAISLQLAGALTDTDGSETLSYTISDIPVGAKLTDGNGHSFTGWFGGSSVSLAGWDLATLKITPPLNSDVDFALTVTATSTEGVGGDTATTVVSLPVTVTAVADVPGMGYGLSLDGKEDMPIFFSVSPVLDDHDGSETLAVSLSGIPVGAVVSDGTNSFTATAGSTSIDLNGWNRGSLTITPPLNMSGMINLTVTATATETSNGDFETITYPISIPVAAVNDAPVITGDLGLAVNEGSMVIVTSTDLGFTDVDDVAAGVTFTVSAQVNGTVLVNGVAATSFTGAQLQSGLVSFQHNGSETNSGSFGVSLEDGNEDGSAPATATVNVVVSPVNDGAAPITVADITQTATAPKVGDILQVTLGADPDGAKTNVVYHWLRDGVDTGATGTTYTLGAGDAGHVMSVQATYADGQSFNESVTSAATAAVIANNAAPEAANDKIITNTTYFSVSDAALLANDGDADGDSLAITSVTASGSDIALHSGSSTTFSDTYYGFYTTYNGGSFSYTVTDGSAPDSATVTVQYQNTLSLTGTSADEILIGSNSAESLNGNGGLDQLYGNGGNDTLYANANAIVMDGGSGTDTLRVSSDFTSTSDGQIVYVEQVNLTSAGILNMSNQAEGFKIIGSSGVDTITGGAGNDIINGGAGNDIIHLSVSNADADQLRFATNTGSDVVNNFVAGQDKIAFLDGNGSGAVAFANTNGTAAGAGLAASDFNTASTIAAISSSYDNRVIVITSAQNEAQILAATNNAQSSYVVVYNSTAGAAQVWFDTNWNSGGLGSRSLVATLNGLTAAQVAALTAADFRAYNSATDPIVLDLDQNGFTFSSVDNGVAFDIDADGDKDQIAWTSDDGILAYDVDGDGVIDNGSEIFTPSFNGGSHASGIAALATLDSNGDGKIDADDTAFSSLSIWIDSDNDGISDAGELSSLTDHGVSSISLGATTVGGSEDGQTVFSEGTFTFEDGTTGTYVEVGFDTISNDGATDVTTLIGTDGDDILASALGQTIMTGGAGADTFVLDTDALHGIAVADVITDYSADEGDTLDITSLLDSLLGEQASEADALAAVKTTVVGSDTVVSVGANNEWHDVAVLQNYTSVVKVLFDDEHHQTNVTHTS
ncbi:tandem-95 repeat protein [Rhizobium sp. S-51]|uniref:Tandem-95 repeat protein n=1 Tax=Rhizobium terricola TaxID=2728849 RepID=A0A7Y0AZJ7_9HYPH|nr:DUF5801 repeats-in-toxin domain-containing protein [Rhizobium terricola]NML76389.1 tandem-95 repeat protein [Rhizobium terricola]